MNLLKTLYTIHAPSGREKRMAKFIKWWILNNVKGATVTTDPKGNLLVTKGSATSYPCIVAHIDQVQRLHSKDFTPIETDDIIFGYSPKHRQIEGLGADDKNGIWVCLKCLEKFPVMKAAFFVEEETGCNGSSEVDMTFFTDCRFVLQCDRKHGNDLITSIWGDLCSEDFLNAIGYEKYGYRQESGLMTDVATLKERGLAVSALNISCGYYEPHTAHEFTVKSELQNCLAFVEHIIETCTDTYPHIDNSWTMMDWYTDPDSPYAYDDEYSELYDLAYSYLELQPDLPSDIFFESYHDWFPHLTKDDFTRVVSDIKTDLRFSERRQHDGQ